MAKKHPKQESFLLHIGKHYQKMGSANVAMACWTHLLKDLKNIHCHLINDMDCDERNEEISRRLYENEEIMVDALECIAQVWLAKGKRHQAKKAYIDCVQREPMTFYFWFRTCTFLAANTNVKVAIDFCLEAGQSYNGFDISRRLGPMRRQRDDADVPPRRVLPAAELVEIRRPHPWLGMRAAWTVFGTDVRPLDVKSLHGFSIGQRLPRP